MKSIARRALIGLLCGIVSSFFLCFALGNVGLGMALGALPGLPWPLGVLVQIILTVVVLDCFGRWPSFQTGTASSTQQGSDLHEPKAIESETRPKIGFTLTLSAPKVTSFAFCCPGINKDKNR